MLSCTSLALGGASTGGKGAFTLLALVLGAASGGEDQANPPAHRSPGTTRDAVAPPLVSPISSPAGGPEVIGPWTIVQAPSSVALIAGGGDIWGWLNVVNAPVSLDQAFTGFSLIDDGYANGEAGTTVEMTFSPAVVNNAGTDLVLFDGRYSANSYAVSSDHDGFVAELALPFFSSVFTGESRDYFYEGFGPFAADVYAAPVDLSDLGVPLGDTVDAVRVIITSTEGDLLGLGVSEPSCPTLGFTTEDDFVTPLVNGQHIDVEFGDLVSITSSGPNAGLAIFDSTVGGPNDPSQDRDLLVGSGNILILQTENYPPDGNDVFPRPNDDEDGGTITFAFASPVEASWTRLIDIDASDGATTVALIDGDGRQRVYTVPSNWTGDLLLGEPGQGTLDLTTLAPQPGFGSIATASESAGFDPTAVVRIDVRLDGSGAVDDLSVCVAAMQRAALTVRNGAEENARSLGSYSLPVLGSTWSAVLDCSAYGRGTATLVGRRRPSSGTMTPLGEVLIDGALVFGETRVFSAAASAFTWSLPNDLALVGLDVHLQGACREWTPMGGRVLRIRGGLSNALDLVLGF